MGQLVQACRANEVTDLILVHEHRGEPGEEWTLILIMIIIKIIIAIIIIISKFLAHDNDFPAF